MYSPPLRVLAVLFSSLIGSTLLAAILVTPGILVQVLWYDPHKSEHRRYVKDNVQCWLFWLASNLIISWYLAVIVDLVPTVIQYFLAAVWGHISESVKSRLELYINVKNTFKPVLYAASAWISWIIIFVDVFALYDIGNPGESRAPYLYRVSILYVITILPDFPLQDLPDCSIPIFSGPGHLHSNDVVTCHWYV